MQPVVSVEAISKQYGKISALSAVSLTIGRGEIFGLIGPNGAGKTTFVRAITGTVSPTSGSVTLFDHHPSTVRKSRIGLLPQSFNPPERLTAKEILEYYAGLYSDSKSVDSLLEAVGMQANADRWYERLSGGQKRRVCIGAALVNDPDLLILDEPTTGIDPTGRRELWSLLESLRNAGKTILITTHDMTEASTLSDRVGLLSGGELIATGPPQEMIDTYGGDGHVVLEPTSPIDDDQLASLPYTVRRDDDELIFDGVAPTDLADIIRTLDASAITYNRITWAQPTLEDVFFVLTETEDVVE